ncbi:hypothetical protein BESB_075220 [Besnoitia besnoiti]|uniref:Aquarius n=1 Tax=Besnoitia besnoiti TaxID=94643 RepID=A0A2A9MG45_BESBE|nr:uncharacterized protein BESB_075220 [Besnoitia besnoiti]PFH34370.1 hypothetical protein BESB_075220 [Besnoitia besnoiti]
MCAFRPPPPPPPEGDGGRGGRFSAPQILRAGETRAQPGANAQPRPPVAVVPRAAPAASSKPQSHAAALPPSKKQAASAQAAARREEKPTGREAGSERCSGAALGGKAACAVASRAAQKRWSAPPLYHPDAPAFFRARCEHLTSALAAARETVAALEKAQAGAAKASSAAEGDKTEKKKKSLVERQLRVARKKEEAARRGYAVARKTLEDMECVDGQQGDEAEKRRERGGKAYDAAFVEKLYSDLVAANFPVQPLISLEFSLFFENYLWPHFPVNDASEGSDEEVSKAHVMCMVLMLLEKHRKNLPIWETFLNHPLLKGREHQGKSAKRAEAPTAEEDEGKRDVEMKDAEADAPTADASAESAASDEKDEAAKREANAREEKEAHDSVAESSFENMVFLPEEFFRAKFSTFFYRLLDLFVRSAPEPAASQPHVAQPGKEASAASSAPTASVLTVAEKSYVVRFLILCFQGLEEAMLRRVCLSVCGAAAWTHAAPKFRSMLLERSGAAALLWKKSQKKLELADEEREKALLSALDGKAEEGDKDGEQQDAVQRKREEKKREIARARLDRDFFSLFLQQFFWLVDDVPLQSPAEAGPSMEVIFLAERMLELLIDLESQLPTRRAILPLLNDLQVVVRARMAALARAPEAGVYKQMVELLDFYSRFEIDEDSGLPKTAAQYGEEHYRRVSNFQRFCFSLSKDIPSLRTAALSAVSALDSPADLRALLDKQELLTLLQMAANLGLVDPNMLPGAPRPVVAFPRTLSSFFARLPPPSRRTKKWVREFLTETLCYFLKRRPDQLEQLNALSLYPSEEEMWNEAILPAEHYTGETALALPKLNLQFLTIHDYLLRNFNLFRLESIYEIREDIQDAIFRMKPRRRASPSAVTGAYGDADAAVAGGRTVFEGTARMAVEVERFSVIAVEKPRVGETVPSEVRAEISIDLAGLKPQVAREWDSLRQFDVLFLVAIVAPQAAYTGRLQDLEQVHEFPQKFGVVALRGCEIVDVLDEDGKVISEYNPLEPRLPMGTARTLRVQLDANQYRQDVLRMEEEGFEDFYSCFNLLVRRNPKHNTFKAVLATIRSLMNRPEDVVIPSWLHDLFLGYGDPGSAQFFRLPSRLRRLDMRDTFLDRAHLLESFPYAKSLVAEGDVDKPPVVLEIEDAEESGAGGGEQNEDEEEARAGAWPKMNIRASTYALRSVGPYPECERNTNKIRFTPEQVRCLVSGLQPGLTMVVGPPGSGKTDTAAHLAFLLYHNFPSEKVVLVSHSNAALNDLFRKIRNLDVDETHLLRLGRGERDLSADARQEKVQVGKLGDLDDEEEDFSFSKQGRVNKVLERRKLLLEKVEKLGKSLEAQDAPCLSVGDVGFSCETALQFQRYHVLFRIERFRELSGRLKALFEDRAADAEAEDAFWARVAKVFADLEQERGKPLTLKVKKDVRGAGEEGEAAAETQADAKEYERENGEGHAEEEEEEVDEKGCIDVDPVRAMREFGCTYLEALFPFPLFFADAPQPLFVKDLKKDEETVESCFRYLDKIFQEIEDCRAFELLRTSGDRANYLITKHARMIAMTCTHAAMTRENLVGLRFQYDSLIIEESAQILEVETFIPMLLQQLERGVSRLKRVVLIGDHHQLPPIVKHLAFQKYSHLDQSLYSRFIRLRSPAIELDMQGRARPSLAALYAWNYRRLGNLPLVETHPSYAASNPGLAFDFQFINVEDYAGKGETTPLPHFYQNLGEAEYVVALYMYMRLTGYPADKITILTTYNGQLALISDVLHQRCAWNPAIGLPKAVATVDKYQGMQNDYILLSLVRTERPGHIRDVRRLIVAVSRARLGLYVFGRWSLFGNCVDTRPVMRHFAKRPLQLALQLEEENFETDRRVRRDPYPGRQEPLPAGSSLVADVTQFFTVVQNRAVARVEALKKQLNIPVSPAPAPPAHPTSSPAPPPPPHAAAAGPAPASLWLRPAGLQGQFGLAAAPVVVSQRISLADQRPGASAAAQAAPVPPPPPSFPPPPGCPPPPVVRGRQARRKRAPKKAAGAPPLQEGGTEQGSDREESKEAEDDEELHAEKEEDVEELDGAPAEKLAEAPGETPREAPEKTRKRPREAAEEEEAEEATGEKKAAAGVSRRKTESETPAEEKEGDGEQEEAEDEGGEKESAPKKKGGKAKAKAKQAGKKQETEDANTAEKGDGAVDAPRGRTRGANGKPAPAGSEKSAPATRKTRGAAQAAEDHAAEKPKEKAKPKRGARGQKK